MSEPQMSGSGSSGQNHPPGLWPVPGDGVLARHGSLILLTSLESGQFVDALLDLHEQIAAAGGDGRRFADAIADAVESDALDVDEAGRGPSVLAFGTAGPGLAVMVSGAAWVDVTTAHGTQRIAGGQPGMLLRCVLRSPVSGVRGGLGPTGSDAVRTDRFSRLDAGTVRAGGLSYYIGGAAPGSHVPGSKAASAGQPAAAGVAAEPALGAVSEPEHVQSEPAQSGPAQSGPAQVGSAQPAFTAGPAPSAMPEAEFADAGLPESGFPEPASPDAEFAPPKAAAAEFVQESPEHGEFGRESLEPGEFAPPEAAQPDLASAEYAQPDLAAQPGSAQPGSAQPGSAQPGSAQPHPPQIDFGQTEVDRSILDQPEFRQDFGQREPPGPQPGAGQAPAGPGWPGQAGQAAPELRQPTELWTPPPEPGSGSPLTPPAAGSVDQAEHEPTIPPVGAEPFESVLLGAGPAQDFEIPAREPLSKVTDLPPGSSSYASNTPIIQGVYCKNAHFDNPESLFCSVCGISMNQQTLVPRPGPRPPLGVLVLDDGSVFQLDSDYVVGREPSLDASVASGEARPLRVTDESGIVSRVHLRVHLDGWRVVVTDLGSANGTRVKLPREPVDQPLLPQVPLVLVAGSEVDLGGRGFRYESHRGQ